MFDSIHSQKPYALAAPDKNPNSGKKRPVPPPPPPPTTPPTPPKK